MEILFVDFCRSVFCRREMQQKAVSDPERKPERIRSIIIKIICQRFCIKAATDNASFSRQELTAWQSYSECSLGIFLGLYGDHSVVSLYDLSAESQSQTYTRAFNRGFAGFGGIKWIEYLLQVFLVNATSSICYLYFNEILCFFCRNT